MTGDEYLKAVYEHYKATSEHKCEAYFDDKTGVVYGAYTFEIFASSPLAQAHKAVFEQVVNVLKLVKPEGWDD